MFNGIKSFFREFSEFNRFFNDSNDKKLVFYSEGGIFYQYFEGIIDYIIENSDYQICYLTSDINDKLLIKKGNRIKSFYIKNTLQTLLSKLDQSIFVLTMTDLDKFYIKRSPNKVNHVYVFHAPVSTHFTYRLGAFDGYDTIFCVGKHHIAEIRRTEELYDLNKKELVEIGYSRIEKIYFDHLEFLKKENKSDKINILIAPTWGNGNIVETCVRDLVNELSKIDKHNIIIRPHPETKKREPKLMTDLKKYFSKINNAHLELDLTSEVSIHNADILITDWSGIAFEYAFGTERPVLFIDTERKIENNPEWEKLKITPMDIELRNKIGKSIRVDDISSINDTVVAFLEKREAFKEQIVANRSQTLFNWLHSSEVAGKYLINLCKTIND